MRQRRIEKEHLLGRARQHDAAAKIGNAEGRALWPERDLFHHGG